MWDPQVAELSQSFRILRVDTRGHGKSEVPPGPYSLSDLTEDFIGLFDELGLTQVNFCGLSMGGKIAQSLALNYPNRIRKIVLANTAARVGTVESWNTRIETVEREGLGAVATTIVERWLTHPYRAKYPETFQKLRDRLIATNPKGYVGCCAAIRDADLRESVRRIGVPTLVITGTHDLSTPPFDGRLLAERISDAQYVELPSAHLSNVEYAGEFNRLLAEFLK